MINQEARELQERTIKAVIEKLQIKEEVTFKAPTGSGKTVMIAQIMNKMIENNSNLVFIVTTLAKSELGVQNHQTFETWTQKLKYIKPYIIDTDNATIQSGLVIPPEFNVYSLTDALFKTNTIINRGPLYQFLGYLKDKGKQIIWIKDECHKEFKNFEELYKSGKWPFIKKLNVSATPQTTKFTIDVEIEEPEAQKTKLIKKLVGKNGHRKQGNGNGYDIDQYQELRGALELLKEIREKYISNFAIRPCMIIQIPFSDRGEYELEHLIPLLNVKTQDGSYFFNWIYICDDVKKYQTNTNLGNEDKLKRSTWKTRWKDEAKKMNSSIDIVIFKMVITEGWDIKRANMLFQITDPDSETLTEQVVGRIRRNPILESWDDYNESQHELALNAYVYGNIKEIDRKFKRVQRTYSDNIPVIKIQTTVLKDLQRIYSENDLDLKYDYEDWRMPDDKLSIFELRKKWLKIDDETKSLIWNNIGTYDDWFKFSYNIEAISEENKRLFKDYNNSIINSIIAELPVETYFEILQNHRNDQYGPVTIKTKEDKYAWKIISESTDEKYYFDSLAEQSFAEEIKYFGKKVWARNYYANSKISFEYINITKHKSFPDFIVLDKNNKYHIFEIKSFDVSNSQNVDRNEYRLKVESLQEFYKELTKKLDNYIFYIPIKYQGKWEIWKYADGNETGSMSLDELKNSFI